MKNTKKKLNNQSKVVKASFTGSNITKYSGLNTVAKYMNGQNIVKSISTLFPTRWHNATKFGVNQILMAITLSSISGISRICKIATFSGDGLVKALLKLDKAINENAISATLKTLGQSGARKLQMLLLSKNAQWLHESGLESITLDTDSTVKSVCGNQEGAAKGWSKPRMLKAMRSVKEYVQGEYLGQKQIVPVYQYACYASSYDMTAIEFHELYKQRSASEFCDERERDQYKTCFDWRAKKQNLQSETWIEQVKGHTMAGSTLTEDFWANDIFKSYSNKY